MTTEIFLLNIEDHIARPVDEYLKYFSPERLQKIFRYKFNADRNRTIFAELLARKLISERTGKSLADVKIFRSSEGRPYTSEPGIFFSLSHAGAWVACSIGDSPNGVDVENLDRKIDINIAKRFFLANEFEILNSLKEEEQTKKFFEFWTLKEACLKFLNLREWSNVDCEKLLNSGRGRNFYNDGAVIGVCCEKNKLPEFFHLMTVPAAITQSDSIFKL